MKENNSNQEILNYSFDGEKVRTVFRNGRLWFFLVDICKLLEIGNPSDVANRLEKTDLDTIEGMEKSGFGEARRITYNIITEDGVYDCILDSRKPEAKRFRRWITHKVIPSIREKGYYSLNTENSRRMLVREHIKDENKKLNNEIHKRGIGQHNDKQRNNNEYATFHNAGYRGLYGGLTKKKISEKKLNKDVESILDYMDEEELSANYFRITQTKAKIKNENIQKNKNLNKAHQEVGSKIRETMIEISGNKIEDLPFCENINKLRKKVKEELKNPSEASSTKFQSINTELHKQTEDLALFLMFFNGKGFITTKELITELPKWIPLPKNYYVQKTKNIISNRSRSTSIFSRNLGTYEKQIGIKQGKIRITKEGIQYVQENLIGISK